MPRRSLFLALAVALLACEGSPTESVDIEGPTLEALGDQVQLPATLNGKTAKWRSFNPTIVHVTPGGLATAVGHGDALLEAEAGGGTEETILTVLPPTLVKIDSLRISPLPAGTELMAVRLFNSGGRGQYRLEAWGNLPDGGRAMYLRTPWTTATVGMKEELLIEVDTPTDGTVSRINWLAVEYQPVKYPDSERVCVGLNRQVIVCPELDP